MTRTLLATMLILTSVGASALEWPWQNSSGEEQPLEYCKGFVVGGLASNHVGGASRTELWLAWNYLIRSDAPGQDLAAKEFQAGLEQFQNTTDAAAALSILQQANGDCGLGRTGYQATGW